jgi:hypothetical protein
LADQLKDEQRKEFEPGRTPRPSLDGKAHPNLEFPIVEKKQTVRNLMEFEEMKVSTLSTYSW